MRQIDEIEADIAELNNRVITPALKDRESLERELRRAKSLNWIKANGVTRDQIQLSSGEGVPWSSSGFMFSQWLTKTNCEKRFCEWQGTIFFTEEMKTGRVDFEANPAQLEDVPE